MLTLSQPTHIHLYQQTGTFSEFQLVAKIPLQDNLSVKGNLENAFNLCNYNPHSSRDSWEDNPDIWTDNVSHSCSVGDIMVYGHEVYCVAGTGFTRLNP